MGKRWQEKRKNDQYYKKAKRKGYRSRAAFKLKQLNEKYDILKPEDVVVDLGAAPGGWLQMAHDKVGEDGFVLGVDLEPIEELNYTNVRTLQADITDEETRNKILESLPKNPDVILSDASPDITGIWDVDHARSVGLVRSSLNLARDLLKPGGNVTIKIFQGELLKEVLKEAKKDFEFCKTSKPEASRKRSSETYIIGKGFSKK